MNSNKNWCKIIYTEKRDFLIERGVDDEDDEKEVVILSTHTNSCFVRVTIGSGSKEQMDDVFKKVDETTIDKILEDVLVDSGINLDQLDS